NKDKVQHTENGCRALESVLEKDCAADKMKQILNHAEKLSDLKDFCPGYKDLPPDKKSEVFKQILAGSIHENGGWASATGYFKIQASDVDQNQACHGIDLTK